MTLTSQFGVYNLLEHGNIRGPSPLYAHSKTEIYDEAQARAVLYRAYRDPHDLKIAVGLAQEFLLQTKRQNNAELTRAANALIKLLHEPDI